MGELGGGIEGFYFHIAYSSRAPRLMTHVIQYRIIYLRRRLYRKMIKVGPVNLHLYVATDVSDGILTDLLYAGVQHLMTNNRQCNILAMYNLGGGVGLLD